MLSKYISYLELLWSLCSVEWNDLSSFGPWHYEEHFCGDYFEFGPVVQEMSLKGISYLELWWSLCSVE